MSPVEACLRNVCSGLYWKPERLHSFSLLYTTFTRPLIEQDEVRGKSRKRVRECKEIGGESKLAGTTCWNWCTSLFTWIPHPSPWSPRPPPPHPPPPPQLVLSTKINDLKVQAQHGARVNLAGFGGMFKIVFSKGHAPLSHSLSLSPQLCAQNPRLLIWPLMSTFLQQQAVQITAC